MAVNAPRLKRRSGASFPSPPESLIFSPDENLGRHVVPEALCAAGEEVKVYAELFSPGLNDREWLRVAGEKGWIVLMKDPGIKYRRNEMQLLLSSGVRAFVLISSNLTGAEIAQIFVKALPRIKKLCARQSAPFIAHVHKDGTVVLVKRRRLKG
jgi:hypothetical protein